MWELFSCNWTLECCQSNAAKSAISRVVWETAVERSELWGQVFSNTHTHRWLFICCVLWDSTVCLLVGIPAMCSSSQGSPSHVGLITQWSYYFTIILMSASNHSKRSALTWAADFSTRPTTERRWESQCRSKIKRTYWWNLVQVHLLEA